MHRVHHRVSSPASGEFGAHPVLTGETDRIGKIIYMTLAVKFGMSGIADTFMKSMQLS